MAVYCYLRVSTDAQEVENQRRGVAAYCRDHGWLPSYVEDSISGRTPWRERGIGRVIAEAHAGDVVVVSEVSRLARSTLQVLEIAQVCLERGLSLHSVKNNLVFDGSMQSKIMSTVLGLAAEIERDLISVRTKEALQRRRAAGQVLGRPVGSTSALKLDSKAADIDRMIASGFHKRLIARTLAVSPQTLYLWLHKRRPAFLSAA